MILSPQLAFRQKPDMHLHRIADEIQRQDMSVSIAPYDKRGKETHWGGGVKSFRVSTDVGKKPFLYVGPAEAILVPGKADSATLKSSLEALARCVEFTRPDPLLAGFAFIGYLAVATVAFKHLSNQYQYQGIVVLLVPVVALLVVSLGAMAWRAFRNPERGRSWLVMLLLFPSFLLLSPMSLLNIPAVRYLQRAQGYRISQTC